VRLLVLTFLLTSCGAINRNCGSDGRVICDTLFGDLQKPVDIPQFDNSENESKIRDLDTRLSLLERTVQLQSASIQSLQSLTEINTLAISANTAAINALVIPDITGLQASLSATQGRIDLLQARIEALEAVDTVTQAQLGVEITALETSILALNSQIQNIETTLAANDEYASIPGCEHSYFVLYNANGNIQTVYVSEEDGTVAGSWEILHNTTYSLLIDGTQVCTGLRLDKNNKKLYYNNGTPSEIDLSY